jgi:hypothetical protein
MNLQKIMILHICTEKRKRIIGIFNNIKSVSSKAHEWCTLKYCKKRCESENSQRRDARYLLSVKPSDFRGDVSSHGISDKSNVLQASAQSAQRQSAAE